MKVDALHDFQYSYFPAGSNQPLADRTMGLHYARVGFVIPQDKWGLRQQWHSGRPSLVQV
jgi:hypothetical protein